jgi:hypothetical protein
MNNNLLPSDLKDFGRQEYEAKAADFWASMIFIASVFSVLGFLVGKFS